MKIDVEGSELAVLKGAKQSVLSKKLPLIVIESTEQNLQSAGYSTRELVQTFTEYGYQLCRFDVDKIQLAPVTIDGLIDLNNVFACLDMKAANKRLRNASAKNQKIALELIERGKEASLIYGKAEKNKARNIMTTAEEHLRMLRRSNIQLKLAEDRIDNQLLKLWPLRLAFKSRLIRAPLWSKKRQRAMEKDTILTEYLAKQGAIKTQTDPKTGPIEKPTVTAILCTFNPRQDLLNWALESLARQTLDKQFFEVLLIDNNSTPPLNLDDYPAAAELPIRIVEQPEQGLTHARLAGIRETAADYIIFIDDDNYLAPNYFEEALKIFESEPEIGLFGGIAHARLEKKIGKWKTEILPFLGIRNHGSEVITSYENHWGEWEPIGAGMCSRIDVAKAYIEFVENQSMAGELGRKGKALLSGEDSLFARVANQQGYACSYQPTLELDHFMSADRLTYKYMFRLMRGHGRSYVKLERILGRGENIKPIDKKELFSRIGYRFTKDGASGLIGWAWDLGFAEEALAEDAFQPDDAIEVPIGKVSK